MDVRPTLRAHRALTIAAAAALPLLICGVLSPVRRDVSQTTAVLVLVLVVVSAAATGDRWAGLVAAVSSAVWFDFFLTAPYRTFAITAHQDVEDTLLLVLIGIAVTELALWGLRQQARASRRAGYLDGALALAEVVSGRHESVEPVVDLVVPQLVEVLGISRCRFVAGPVYDARFAVMGHDGVVTRNGRVVDVERDGLPTDEETALLIAHEGDVVGHFLLTSAADVARPSLEQRRAAVLLADQVGSVLGRLES